MLSRVSSCTCAREPLSGLVGWGTGKRIDDLQGEMLMDLVLLTKIIDVTTKEGDGILLELDNVHGAS